MTSSSADCTLAGARLISSASRKLQNTGPSSVSNAARVRPVDARADEVGRHEVGRELQALERAAEHVGDGLDGQRLGQARDALEQHVAAGQQRHEHALEHRLLADDDALDLEERGLERVVGRRGTGWAPPGGRARGAADPLGSRAGLLGSLVRGHPPAGFPAACRGPRSGYAGRRRARPSTLACSPGLRAATAAETSSEDGDRLAVDRGDLVARLQAAPSAAGPPGTTSPTTAPERSWRVAVARRRGRRARPCRRSGSAARRT